MPLLGFSFEPRNKADLLLPIVVCLLPLVALATSPDGGGVIITSPILHSFTAILESIFSLAIFWIALESYRISGSKQLYWFSLAFFVFGLTALIRGFANESLVSVNNVYVASIAIFSVLFVLAIRTRGVDESQKIREQKGTTIFFLAFAVAGLSIGAEAISGVALQRGLTLPLEEVCAMISVPLLSVSSFYFLRGFFRQPAGKVLFGFGVASLLMIDIVGGFFFPQETIYWWVFRFLFVIFLGLLLVSFRTLSPSEEAVSFKPLLAMVFGIEALVASGIIIISWFVGVGGFLTLYANTIAVAPFTSISALLISTSAAFYLRSRRIYYATTFAMVTLIIGTIGLAGVLTGSDPFTPINDILFSAGRLIAPPLALNTALAFVFSSSAVLLYIRSSDKLLQKVATLLASLSFCVGLSTLLGYAFSVEILYRWTSISVPMAPVTGILVTLTSLSVLFSSFRRNIGSSKKSPADRIENEEVLQVPASG